MSKRKNLLYVFADQWRATALGVTGEDPVRTENMDAFAKESVSVTGAISSYPLCSPHRAALLTGKHPLSCGFWTNCKAPLSDSPNLSDGETCISDVLAGSGYDTAYVGKWHLTRSELNDDPHPVSGAAGWDAYTPPGPGRHGFAFWHSYGAMDNHLFPHYWEDSPRQINVEKWSPEHETDVLLSYLEGRKSDKPFCAFLSWNPPHPPYDLVPGKYLENTDILYRKNVPLAMKDDPSYLKKREEYFAAVHGLDEQFGRIVTFLKGHGLWDDTVVVLSADHGDMMGSHGLYGKNIWYEESVRIPFYLHDRAVGAGTKDILLASEDQAPTLLGLLCVPVPPSMQGCDASLALRGDKDAKVREAVYLCMIPGMPDLVEAYRKKGLDQKRFGWRAMRDKNHLYVHDKGIHPGDEERLLFYDLQSDPYEMRPRTPTEQEKGFAEAWMRDQAKGINDHFFKDVRV